MKLSDAIYKRLVLLNFVLLFCFLLAGVLIVGALKEEFQSYVVNRYKAMGKLEFYRSKLTAKALRNKPGHEAPPLYEIKIQEGALRDIQLTVEQMLAKATYRDGETRWAVMGDEDKKWYPVTFRADGEDYHAKIRIRGDLENHWAHAKKSWRIKFAKEKLFHGRHELNIVLPGDKGYTMERVAQEMARELGLLVPDSGYAQVRLNGVEMGLYFWFENNSPEMLEKLRYPEGEIFRENNTWVQTNYTGFGIPERFINIHPGNFTSSIHRDPALGYYAARWNRLLQLTRGEAPENFEQEIASLVDVEKYAKWNALTWLFASTHSQWSDNLRWYYDPTTGLFEPLLYDVQSEPLENQKSGTFEVQSDDPLARRMMRIPKFHEMRNKALWQMVSDPQFDFGPRSEKLFAAIRPYLFMGVGAELEADKIDMRHLDQKGLCGENRQKLKDNLAFGRIFITPVVSPAGGGSALELRIIPDSLAGIQMRQLRLTFSEELGAAAKDVRFKLGDAELASPHVAVSQPSSKELVIDFKDLVLHTLRDEKLLPQVGAARLTLEFPSISADKWATQSFLAATNWTLVNSISDVPFGPQYVFQAPLAYAWPASEQTELPRSVGEFVAASGLPFQIDGKKLVLGAGEYTVNRNLIVPPDFGLQLEAGVVLRLAPGVSIVSYQPLTVRGTKEQPVRITALDPKKPWGSFAIVRARGLSKAEHLIVSDGYEAHVAGLYLSGQLCFYSSEVELRHCVIENGHADDGLNIKRANMLVENCTFRGNAADAFDGDWVRGRVENCLFEANGGDGLDVSGSFVVVENTSFVGMRDKGMSVGENTRLYGINNVFRDSVIGVASKDMSQVNLYASVFYGNETGISLYRKKQVFGGAHASLAGCLFWKNGKDFALDAESDLRLVGVGVEHWEPQRGITADDLRVGKLEESYVTRGRFEFAFEGKPGSPFAKGPVVRLEAVPGFVLPDLTAHPLGLIPRPAGL